MAGLQGSGKTTTSGKLARMLRDDLRKKVLLVSCDVYRPAAIDQLRTIATQLERTSVLSAEVVVLSGCRTALGKEVRGESDGNGPVDASLKAIESHVKSGAVRAIAVTTRTRASIASSTRRACEKV
jgi:signal recognition particle GTPase